MPDLIREMKTDFNDPKTISIRDIEILPKDQFLFNSEEQLYRYYRDQHEHLTGNIAILADHGYIELKDISKFNAPIYRV